MSSVDDEFDLDICIHVTHDERFLRPRPQQNGLEVQAGDTNDDTCGLDCQTQTCPEATCGCITIETCDQRVDSCSPMACGITFPGNYCEDETDGCGDPGPGGGEPADTDFCHLDLTELCD
jgi:hypothetical protein